MNEEEIQILRGMVRAVGVFEVTRTLRDIAKTFCSTDYAENPFAIIHSDTEVLIQAVSNMRMKHPHRPR